MTPKETNSLKLLTKINVGTAIGMVAVLFGFHNSNLTELRAMRESARATSESIHEIRGDFREGFADHEVRIEHLERGR